MATLFYGIISSINYSSGTANITLQDRENQVIQGVPFLSAYYEMPRPGETVAVLFEELNGQIGKGVILGTLFLDGNKPGEYGPDIFYKQFADGAGMKYTPDSGELEIKVKKVVVNEIEYKAAQKG
ncbi:MAG: phage baseplate assembly protein V [Lachnospiraceae bacterium]|nr:phage baseplate assembly protein V [Lachnospiraceae bacterium]MBO5145462.1 phage baseplate assembly protein V [Lachnospiraceae bacterium]